MRTVLCAEGLFEPTAAIQGYLESRPPSAADPVTLLFGVRRTPLPPGLGDQPHLRLRALIPGRSLRTQHNVSYERKSYSQVCRAILTGELRLDALIAVAGEPSRTGTRSLGVINGYLQLAADMAATVVVEQLPGLPRISGAAEVRAAHLVLPAAPPTPFAGLSGEPDEVSRKIAAHVAGLLPPACTLSLGVGKVADAVADQCCDLRQLGLISGFLGSGAKRLDEAGALDNQAKIQAMSVLGGPDVTEWAAHNHRVQLLPSTLLHDAGWLASHPRLVTVLGALAVDSVGNANSEQIGGRQISGMGGAPDFAAGAAGSTGGLCIVTLPSRDRSGRPTLSNALDMITVGARHVAAIVTENGAAVRGRSPRRWHADLQRIF